MRDLADAVYVPGSWVAMATQWGCLLVDLPPEDPVVRRCWKLLSEDAGADALLDALAAGGIAHAPGFALVVRMTARLRSVTRHPAAITASGDAGEIGSAAAAEVSWLDETLDATWDSVSLHGPVPSTSVELPMGSGVTTASVVLLRRGLPTAAEPVAKSAVEPVVEPVVEPDPEPVIEPVSAEPEPADVEPGPQDSPAPVDASYDHLFVDSIRRPNRPETPPAPESDPAPLAPPVPPASPRADTAAWATMPPTPETGIIAGVPWGSSGNDDVAVPPPIVAESPQSDVTEPGRSEATVSRAQLRGAALTGPTVLAGRCPVGHLSPPHAEHCRICRAPMPPQDAFEIARPILGVLRMPSGELVTLDRGVVLGRSPDVPEGSDRPHVLRVKSPDNDVSRNHAEIVLDGWNVYVRDLGSVNGTVVQLTGRDPVRVRENELTLIEDGAQVVLADEVTIVFEARA